MFYQISLSPQVKRLLLINVVLLRVIITYKRGIYELRQELQNDLRLRILGNPEISENCFNLHRMVS